MCTVMCFGLVRNQPVFHSAAILLVLASEENMGATLWGFSHRKLDPNPHIRLKRMLFTITKHNMPTVFQALNTKTTLQNSSTKSRKVSYISFFSILLLFKCCFVA